MTVDWITCRVCFCPYPEGGRCPRNHDTPNGGDEWGDLLAAHLPEPDR